MTKQRRGLEYVDRRVGATIRRARIARGMSQMALGNELDVTFQQIQKYEKGSNAIASTRVPTLCRALDLSPNDLFEWKER